MWFVKQTTKNIVHLNGNRVVLWSRTGEGYGVRKDGRLY